MLPVSSGGVGGSRSEISGGAIVRSLCCQPFSLICGGPIIHFPCAQNKSFVMSSGWVRRASRRAFSVNTDWVGGSASGCR
eukprot:scaffold145688_cov133-Phaeocystis_antarctica.AAC.1